MSIDQAISKARSLYGKEAMIRYYKNPENGKIEKCTIGIFRKNNYYVTGEGPTWKRCFELAEAIAENHYYRMEAL